MEPVTVWLGGGVVLEEKTFALGAADSGTAAAPVRVSGAEGGRSADHGRARGDRLEAGDGSGACWRGSTPRPAGKCAWRI